MEKKIVLYHGSDHVIRHPEHGKGKTYNDYGQAFYCTTEKELAGEWASSHGDAGVINAYELELSGMDILDLSSPEYSALNWIAILLDNRHVRFVTPTAVRARDFLLRKYRPEKYREHDIIIGYRADDSYFSFARYFVTNQISLEQLSKALVLGKLGMQTALVSPRAFASLTFLGSEEVDGTLYGEKKALREQAARRSFQEILETDAHEGTFIHDLLKEEKTR